MPNPVRTFLSLGSNLGNRTQNLQKARQTLAERGVLGLLSSVLETEPWGLTDQPTFLNQVIEFFPAETDPEKLMEVLLEIERSLGRDRKNATRWGPRIIDIDLLTFGDLILEKPTLTLPHPRLAERSFVLLPWAEIAPEFVPPGYILTVRQMAEKLMDNP